MAREDWMVVGIATAVVVALFAVIGAIGYSMNKATCRNQWEGSGMKSEYGMVQGCIITLPDGRRIPAENYREI